MEENQDEFLVSIVAPGDFIVWVYLLQHTNRNGVVRFSIALQQFDKQMRHSRAITLILINLIACMAAKNYKQFNRRADRFQPVDYIYLHVTVKLKINNFNFETCIFRFYLK
jgi:hypothetical protein